MRAGPVLLISTITHGALLALVAPSRSPQLRPFVVPTLPRPQEPLVEVEYLGAELTAKTPSEPRPEQKGGSIRSVPRPSASSAATTVASIKPSSSGLRDLGALAVRSSGSSPMHMRSGVELGLESDLAERIAGEPGHRGHEPYVSGQVEHRHDGTGVVHDSVTKLEIERDGSAHFHDKKYIDLHFHLPIPTFHFDLDEARQELGKVITEWYADPYKMTRYGRTQDLPEHLQAVPGACDSWDSLWCEDPLAPAYAQKVHRAKKETGSFASGNLDITAWLYRKYAGDPYASRKLKLLEDTADERAEMGAAYRTQHLEASREIMRQNLLQLWRATTNPAERKAALFELWDECGEGEGAVGEAGDHARVVVVDWIRDHLPKGSAGAYTDEELASLAARRSSKQRFEPY